jgi:hypothetical protein
MFPQLMEVYRRLISYLPGKKIEAGITRGSNKNQQKNYTFFAFGRKLLLTTDTELKAIAAPAIIGFNRNPLIGYRLPACNGNTNMIINECQISFA